MPGRCGAEGALVRVPHGFEVDFQLETRTEHLHALTGIDPLRSFASP